MQDIAAYVRGLEAALQSLAADPASVTSLRRLARSLAHAADASGESDIAARARRVHEAGHAEIERATRDLLAYVEVVRSPAPDRDLEILIVEDDRTVATTVHSHVKRQARRVHVAATAHEAESLLAVHAIDVVILDLILPDGDGRDILVRLREDPRTANMPVIVLSAESGPVARAECMAVGASEFFAKPPDPKALRAAIARHTAVRPRPAVDPIDGTGSTVPTSTGASLRVLLVEDDRVTSTLIRHRLTRDGLEVTDFVNGEDALHWAEESSFDVAILDVKVPGMDGFELLERLRRIPRLAAVPIVMLTGLGGEADVVRGLELGANDYMVKPFSPAELLARVRRLVSTPRAGTPERPAGAGAR